MPIDVVPVKSEHVPELGRICFEAFGVLHRRHCVPPDFDSIETARKLVGMMVARPDFAGFAAMENGKLIGSNFISFTDAVSGVGPITVDPACQSRGVGRLLMQAVRDEAKRRGVERVRLMQEAVNTVSLSLYTSLGFHWREAVAIMQLTGADSVDPDVRAMREGDLPEVARLGIHHYRHSRVNEVEWALKNGLPALVRERLGRLVGYLVPGFLGHGFAETEEDMLGLLGGVARSAPPAFHKVLVPLDEQVLYRALLGRGSRTLKVMNYMTMGPYEPPRAAWIPSISN